MPLKGSPRLNTGEVQIFWKQNIYCCYVCTYVARVSFLEPLAGVAPKVKDIEVGSLKKIAPSGHVIPLVCTAQGYPAPKFRYSTCLCSSYFWAWIFDFFLFGYMVIFLPEPTNNLAPKALDKKYGFSIMSSNVGGNLFLLCQVVGYPVPVFR